MKSLKLIKHLDIKTLLGIALPISIQSLIQSSLGLIDQIMVGQLGEVAVSSVSLGGRLFFILNYTLSGITAVASIYTSQYEGANNSSKNASVMKATIFGSLIFVIPFFAIAVLIPNKIIAIFTNDIEVISGGVLYLLTISVSFFPKMFSISISSILRSTKKSKIPLITGFISVCTNTSLNYLFIFGFKSIPAMGIKGAAIATVISRFIECIILISYMEVSKHSARLSKALKAIAENSFYINFALTALPAIGTECLWAIGDAAYTAIYGHIGTDSLTAMTMTFPIQSMAFGFCCGLSVATGVIIGNLLGAGEKEKAYETAKDFFKLSIIVSVVIALIILFGGSYYMGFYKVSEQVKEYGNMLLKMVALFLWVKVSNMVMLGGVLRSGGKTRYTFFLDVLGTWGIGIPCGLIAALIFKWNIVLVYIAISFEEIVRLTLGLIRVKSKKWINSIE